MHTILALLFCFIIISQDTLRQGTLDQVVLLVKGRVNHIGDMKLLAMNDLKCKREESLDRTCTAGLRVDFGNEQLTFVVQFRETL